MTTKLLGNLKNLFSTWLKIIVRKTVGLLREGEDLQEAWETPEKVGRKKTGEGGWLGALGHARLSRRGPLPPPPPPLGEKNGKAESSSSLRYINQSDSAEHASRL
jgi:hypothetical protein